MKYPILVADPDLQMGGGEVGACFHQTLGWGGGGGRGLLSPDPEIRGGGRPQFGLKISGGGGPPGLLPWIRH